MATEMVVLISGTSSGMGEATARYLATRGFRVVGGNLPSSPAPDIPGVRTFPLDVREDDSVQAFIEDALKTEGRIDAIFNNAGFGLGGAVEETTMEEARGQMETNFFGVVRMVKAILPHFREQGHGRIINTSSGAGLTAGPFHAFYSASKFAVEGFTEALRHECEPLKIHVSLVEPGSFRTHVVKNGQFTKIEIPAYAKPRSGCLEAVTEYIEKGPDPILIAKRVQKILRSRKPGLRYRVGTDVTWGYFFRRILPESTFLNMVAKHYRLR